ncbi:DJ-1/PfpI family protein [Nostoc sp.]|uniref:DJ-1/PfpI family protein n=1 Tax=Nostoc sp. TaxID=1180 RepID=UPI002FF756A4
MQYPSATIPPEQHIQIGALVFPNMDQIDLTGPFAVLSRLPNSSFQLIWKSTMPVRDHKGLRLLPDASLANAKPIDLLIVPGGPGQEDLMEDKQVLSFLTAQAGRAKCVFSVCTGALLCGAAGLLKGLEATTHWQSVQFLKYFGAVPKEQRVVIDRTFVSAAGLTAGMDGALKVAALLRGEAIAQAIQLDIQYAPEPPFDSGTPDRAPTEIVAKLKQTSEKLTAQRLATARRVAAKLGVRVDD